MHLQFVQFLADREKGNKKVFFCLVSTSFLLCHLFHFKPFLFFTTPLSRKWPNEKNLKSDWEDINKAVHRKKRESNISFKREENYTMERPQSCGYIHMWSGYQYIALMPQLNPLPKWGLNSCGHVFEK